MQLHLVCRMIYLTKLKFGILTNSSGMLWFNHVFVTNTISDLCVLITFSASEIFEHIDLALNNSTLGTHIFISAL